MSFLFLLHELNLSLFEFVRISISILVHSLVSLFPLHDSLLISTVPLPLLPPPLLHSLHLLLVPPPPPPLSVLLFFFVLFYQFSLVPFHMFILFSFFSSSISSYPHFLPLPSSSFLLLPLFPLSA